MRNFILEPEKISPDMVLITLWNQHDIHKSAANKLLGYPDFLLWRSIRIVSSNIMSKYFAMLISEQFVVRVNASVMAITTIYLSRIYILLCCKNPMNLRIVLRSPIGTINIDVPRKINPLFPRVLHDFFLMIPQRF